MWWIVGIVGGLIVIGLIVGRYERKNAPKALAKAEAAFARGDDVQTLALLKDAFWIPDNDTYSAADANHAVAAIALLDRTIGRMGFDSAPLTTLVKAELRLASQAGGKLPGPVLKAIKEFLANPGAWVLRETARRAQGLTPAPAFAGVPITDEAEQTRIVNAVGRKIVLSTPALTIAQIDRHLPNAQGGFRALLLNQRGGAHAMLGDPAGAVPDYEAAYALDPTGVNRNNLCETYEQIGRTADALRLALEILAVDTDPDHRETASNVVRRFG